MATHSLNTVRRLLVHHEPELRCCGVRHLAIFDSVVRGEDSPDSDIDLAVEIEPGRPFSLIRIEATRLLLQDTLNRPVDLGEIDTLAPNVRSAFERDKVPIF